LSVRASVQAKLFGAFGVVVLLMLAVGLIGIARLGSDNAHLDQLASKVVPSTRMVGDINAKMNQYRKDQFHYVLALPRDRAPSAPDSVAVNLSDDLAAMAGYLRAYRSQGLIEDHRDRVLMQTFQAEFYRYVRLSAPFRRLADQGHTILAGKAIGKPGPADPVYDLLKTDITAWSDYKVKIADAVEAASRSSYHDSVALILALLVVALLIAVAVAAALARRMTRAVRDVGSAAKAISQGDIDQRVQVRSDDEFGEMAKDFDSMIEYLRSTVTVAETIARGNLDIEVTPRSARDALGISLATMTQSLRSLVAENARLLEATRKEANTDALTGLPNRRALMRDLEARLAGTDQDGPLILALFDLNGFKQYNDMFGHSAGDALLTRLSDRLREALDPHATPYRIGGDEFCVLANADDTMGPALAARAANALGDRGEAFAIDCAFGVANLPSEADTSSDALRLADRRMYERKGSGRRSASRQTADVLLKVLEQHAPGLGEHTNVVAQLAAAMTRKLGLGEPEVLRITQAAELHDIGKIAIPDTILSKPGPLDQEEWDFVRRHTIIGEHILLAAPALAPVAELVRCHHERYDGTGYPHQLAREQIPIGASVVAVCDAFAAMTSKRSYSAAVTVGEAIDELRRCAGTQFHPGIVEAFCEMIANPDPPPRDAASATSQT
jgi:diguanylate cyclase (GGDEF)-like protein